MQGMWLFLGVLFSENWKLALVLLNYWKRSVRVLLNLFSGCILLNLYCKAPIINLSDVFVILLICAFSSICAAFWAWLIRWRALLLNSTNAFFPLNRGKKKYFCDGMRLNLLVQITSLKNTLLAKALTVASLHLTADEQFDMKIQTRLGFIWRIPNYANNSVFPFVNHWKNGTENKSFTNVHWLGASWAKSLRVTRRNLPVWGGCFRLERGAGSRAAIGPARWGFSFLMLWICLLWSKCNVQGTKTFLSACASQWWYSHCFTS